ncbi:MAG: pantoate--beta-alanine ligase [Bacteroidia bacterium]|nr:pantoate--beta-alanine ligase [Bacteroidia bacterium]
MHVFREISSFLNFRKKLNPELQIGLVPTMGALHEGHASLVEKSVSENDLTIVTIFVNPTQFGPNEDFEKYPRTLEKDCALLEKIGADVVFAPERGQIYPGETQIYFNIRDLDKKLCGASRPGHMNGVVQVVSILFHLIQPSKAYFGLKDYQQCLILQQMVKELFFPLTVVPCPIVREKDGLAMSSRNVYLSVEERTQALFLSQTMRIIKDNINDFRDTDAIRAFIQEKLTMFPIVKLDYFEILNDTNLKEISALSPDENPRMFIAAYLGKTRLIDNMRIFD